MSDTTIGARTASDQTTPTDPLLASKLTVPEALPFSVDRSRLIDQLSHAVRNPMTVVTGPPGSGKTQLAASWVASGAAPGPVIWISLDDGDNDSAVFWPYLVEGLHRNGIALSPPIAEAARNAAFDRPMLARLAADLAAGQQPVVLVLDSASVLADRKLAEELDALLRHADQHLRLVLVGRWDPPLPLYRYRLNGTLSEIRADDLAFTADETAGLLAGHAVELPEWAVAALVERTEGWAVGLRLFALAMAGRADAEELVATIAGDDANIAEYFLGEVLAAQPPEIRDFLLRTSIVDDFTPELAEALTEQGNARHIIAVLERANAFVQPVAARSTVHRYHRLFVELLRAQLAYEKPVQTTQLHRRAAAWFAVHDQGAAAIRHAIAAGDWEYACALLVEDLAVGRLLTGEDTDQFGRLFHDVPADTAGSQAAAVLAAKDLAAGDPDQAVRRLNAVEQAAANQPVPSSLTMALLDAVAAMMRHDDARALDAAGTAQALLALASPARVAAHPELRTILLVTKGTAQSRTGALADAVVTLADAVDDVLPAGCEGVRLAGLEQLALAHAYRGRLQDAADTAARAFHLVGQRRRTPPRPSAAASAVLAWVATERWSVADAWRHLRAAEAGVREADDPLTTVALAVVRSRLLSGRGELRGAARALDEAHSDGNGELPAWLGREIAFAVARLDVVMGRPGRALAAARALASAAPAEAAVVSTAALVALGETRQAEKTIEPIVHEAGLPARLQIEAWLLVAVVAGENGEANSVRDALGHALARGATDGHRRAFHQAGPWLRQLLRNDNELAAEYQALGAPALPKTPVPAVSAPAADKSIVVDPLSERELEVLRHLAAMMGTEEIADAMYLSVNTVKTHVRSILRKLAASRRNEAVRRARALGIV
jgi:LuxR family transcriptional regulator, maltose regulon positive regulatory protein